MAKGRSEKERAYTATSRASKNLVSAAADAYVNKGLKDLNLSSEQYSKLKNTLTPIVKQTIQAERARTAIRGEAVVNRTAVKKVKAAEKKIMGGK